MKDHVHNLTWQSRFPRFATYYCAFWTVIYDVSLFLDLIFVGWWIDSNLLINFSSVTIPILLGVFLIPVFTKVLMLLHRPFYYAKTVSVCPYNKTISFEIIPFFIGISQNIEIILYDFPMSMKPHTLDEPLSIKIHPFLRTTFTLNITYNSSISQGVFVFQIRNKGVLFRKQIVYIVVKKEPAK